MANMGRHQCLKPQRSRCSLASSLCGGLGQVFAVLRLSCRLSVARVCGVSSVRTHSIQLFSVVAFLRLCFWCPELHLFG